jgi:hypothetical protein
MILVGRYLIGTLKEGSPRRKGGKLVSTAASYQGLFLVRPAILKGFSWVSSVTPGKCRGSTLTQTTTVSFHFCINMSLASVVEQTINKYIKKYTTIREEYSVVWLVASCGWLNSAVS